MPTSDDSGSSTPDLDRSIIHDIRPGLFEPPRYSITPPRPRRVKSYRSIRRDGREYSRADQRYFILELHQRLLRVIAERNATGEAEPPPRYIELAKTPFNWSHYDNVPKHERSERMDLNGMDKLEEERLFQITVKALLKLYDTDPNKFFEAITAMNEEAREQMEECRAVEHPSAEMVETISKITAAEAVVPRNAGDAQSQSSPLAPRSEGIASPYRLVAIILRPITEPELQKGVEPILRESAGNWSQLGPATKSRLLPDPKPWIPFGKPSAGDRPFEQVTEIRPVYNLRTDLFGPYSKRTEFTDGEIQALNVDINRIRVIMAARQELELMSRRVADTGPVAIGRLSMELDSPGLAAWTYRHRDQSDQDWRMQIINQLCDSGSTSSEIPTAGERSDNRPSIGTRMPYFHYQMNPPPENGHAEAWRARRDEFENIGTARAAKRSRLVSLLRPY
ncbi:hypothetical protein EHS25_005220 [Saitozyma podzolica]|uniref:Uncharacterized protein n=1 Tax=Saitozyma podzolica TaxID=1890683 RepID=A0A427XZ36_9TREE|nr:hypothetical protein EHS25_005220 [Saitozyma podzolica]